MTKPNPLDPECGGPPCQRCLKLAYAGKIDMETVMPVPEGAFAPRAQDTGKPCCYDCGSADALSRFPGIPSYEHARVAVANDRMEQLRMPEGMRPLMGLAQNRLIRVSIGTPQEALARRHAWMDMHLPGWNLDEDDAPPKKAPTSGSMETLATEEEFEDDG
jgi:hypothetical protein